MHNYSINMHNLIIMFHGPVTVSGPGVLRFWVNVYNSRSMKCIKDNIKIILLRNNRIK